MPNYLQKIIDLLVAVVLMFLIPALYFSLKKDVVIQVNADRMTSDFVETIAADGYVTTDMYEKYLEGLADTDKLYNVELIHEQTAFEPEYKLRSSAEVIKDDEDLWTGTNEYFAPEVVTEVPTIADPISTGSMNTDTNASIIARAVNTLASPSHIHTNACYTGHRHTDGQGVTTSSYQHGCYTSQETVSSFCGGHLTFIGTGTAVTTTCPQCGKNTYNVFQDVYRCDRCSQTYYYAAGGKCTSCGYGGHTAPSVYPLCTAGSSTTAYKCNLVEDTSLDCGLIIDVITPTNPVQTVWVGDPIISTVVVTYHDGSTKTVLCTTPFSTANIVQNAAVTLTYSYTLDGIQYNKTCSITVTVVPKNKNCINGHIYNLNTNGSDPGCPYCHGWLRSLAVLVPSSGSLIIYRNLTGSLETEGVGLIAVYLDGHTEYVYNSYIDNLDPDYVGTQTVTIGYKGLTTSLTVHVVRNRKKCDVCSLYYDLYMDDTDPGCPYCKAKVPVFTGHVKKYTSATYEDQITKELFEGSGIYYFRRGDVFTVEVESRKAVSGLSMIGRLFGLNVNVRSSDIIKNEEVHY